MQFFSSLPRRKNPYLRTVSAVLTLAGLAMIVAASMPAQAQYRAYVANGYSNSVSVIETAKNTVAATIGVGTRPWGVAITPDGRHAYVANFYGAVSVIDTKTNKVEATIAVGAYPMGVAITPDGRQAYVTNYYGKSVSVIDTASNTVAATVPVGAEAAWVAINPEGSRAYVAVESSNTVEVIDTQTNVVTATISVENSPVGVAISREGGPAYVTGFQGPVVAIDTIANTVTATLSISGWSVAITPDGLHAYVTNPYTNSVFVIDTATNVVEATISVPNAYAIAITPDGSRAYVTNNYSHFVHVIDTATNTVTATVSVGSDPFGVAIGPPAATGADLALQIAAAPSPVASHSLYTYTFNVTNNGPEPSAWPRLVAHVPYGATFHSYKFLPSGTGGTGYCVTPAVGARGDVTCRYQGTQPVGTTWTVNLTVWAWAPPVTVITQTAGTWAATHDPNTSNNVVTIPTDVQ